ncbi:hypothetical protein [Pantoea sp. GD03673]|uniref:hypothetical protein n=1 Tax=Pantoea sp. GD03673 TaxID=2975364 RepID=UPI002446AEED|nr:hypothetical protein [Pantoea sp. GD03673]MDH2066871.1 hypothetical protein [Pantoea sp. GD03673]
MKEHPKDDCAEAVQSEKDDGNDLLLPEHEIFEQSVAEASAYVIAAFKIKTAEYTFIQTKWTSARAPDSAENPACLIVPAETIASQGRITGQYQNDLNLKLCLSEQHDHRELALGQMQRFSAVLLNQLCTVLEFSVLVEQSDRDCGSNILILRPAARGLPDEMTIRDMGARAA